MALSLKVATYFEGEWTATNTPIIKAADHAAWLGSMVFDGARRFEGMMPDLDLHCARLLKSAQTMGLVPKVTAAELVKQVYEGVKLFDPKTDLYIRPMMWCCDGGEGVIDLDANAAAFAICIEAVPLKAPSGVSLTVAPYCRPRQDMALTEAKGASLYPNNSRIMAYARTRGFSNALSLDIEGFVAETASTNVFYAKGGIVFTPKPNVCFLNGITRQRVIELLRKEGVEIQEASLTVEDFKSADEIFITGNMSKVVPIERLDDQIFPVGPLSKLARQKYWEFSKTTTDPVMTL